jgi:hypothetical protein
MWNRLRDEQVVRLLDKGFTRGQIAGVMKMTRSAISGRIWRLMRGTSSPEPALTITEIIEAETAEPEPFMPDCVEAPVEKVSTLLPITIGKTDPNVTPFKPRKWSNDCVPEQQPTMASLFVSLLELPEGGCRFPVGGATCCDTPHLFCGEEAYTVPGKKHHSPYCLTHYKMSYHRGY